VSAGVRDARVTVSSRGEQLVLALLWDSERAGQPGRDPHAPRALGGRRMGLAEQAPLSGRVQAQLPASGLVGAGAAGLALRGSLSADITVPARARHPSLPAPRRGRLGAALGGGRNRIAQWQAAGATGRQRLVVSEFLLHGSDEGGGGGGTLLAYGEGSWTPQGPSFQAQAQLSQLRASIRSTAS
jgi:translocation and assembly module TamB